ncbi:MAG: hypothetical protein KC733_10515 [Candidatus Omnitrophica bacterium]|nr:hypothetical protein [Candidatus Omnitrophota bacterium]
MKAENKKILESLAKTCHNSGILPIFLGILIIFIGTVNMSSYVIAVGLFIFIVGYSYLKISQKLKKIISSE